MALQFELPDEFQTELKKSLRQIYTEAIDQARRDSLITVEYLNLRDACKMYNVSNNTLQKWINDSLPIYVIDGKKYLKREEINDYIESHKI